MPKISVIVPVYKVEKYLNRCVDNILNQTFKDFEIILVDDGSPDNCPAICDDYAAKYDFVHVIHKENGGLSDARNYGIDWAFKNSDSEWITFIDSDDWVHKQYLEILYSTAVDNKVKLVSCGFIRATEYFVYSDIEETINIFVDNPDYLLAKGLKYDQYNFSIACARLYKRNLFNSVRFPVGKLHEDEYTVYKLIYACAEVAVVLKNLYFYFNNSSSIMHANISEKGEFDKLDSLLKQCDYFYSKQLRNSLNSSFRIFCDNLYRLKKESAKSGCFENLILIFNNELKKRDLDYIDDKPDLLTKFGCNKILRGEPFRKQELLSDYYVVKKRKGLIYAWFWFVKNYYKNKLK